MKARVASLAGNNLDLLHAEANLDRFPNRRHEIWHVERAESWSSLHTPAVTVRLSETGRQCLSTGFDVFSVLPAEHLEIWLTELITKIWIWLCSLWDLAHLYFLCVPFSFYVCLCIRTGCMSSVLNPVLMNPIGSNIKELMEERMEGWKSMNS